MKLIMKIFLLLFLFIIVACEQDENVIVSNEVDQSSQEETAVDKGCLLYTSPSPRDGLLSRMPSSA